MPTNYLDPAEIRALFASAISEMYRVEVPMYDTLLSMVRDINQQTLEQDQQLRSDLQASESLERINVERHGAIRLGHERELFTMRRLFAVMGMYPVSYYNLVPAGIPVHSTAFRPISREQLRVNPFRMFCSLLQLELITDPELQQRARELLDARSIFSEGVIELIERCEHQRGLNAAQAGRFVEEAIETFRWHREAAVDHASYQQFKQAHPLVADIVCFKGPHINHLTPRTLDIDRVQATMPKIGLNAKALIEGPPNRRHPILLRQTSFHALEEAVEFSTNGQDRQPGTHTARFGEIEQRGMALTPKGRQLYDQLLNTVRRKTAARLQNPPSYQEMLEQVFAAFPDTLSELHNQRLAYFNYHAATTAGLEQNNIDSLDDLVANNILSLAPVTYEDFLPVSAAGIFQSNLGAADSGSGQHDSVSSNRQDSFERALGTKLLNEFELYASAQLESLQHALKELALPADKISRLSQQL
jgi:uncharacterized glyoxalase superfamily metalloenzyme YdcJ